MAARAVGIDIGGTTIKAGVVDAAGTVARQRQEPTPRDPDALVDVIAAVVADLGSPESAVGVVAPGVTDERTGVVEFSANLGWRDLPLQSLLRDRLGRPVAFGHDVRAGALAESLWGAGEPDMLFVPIGTGVSAALVLGGAPRGTGWAGEIGQVLVPDPDGGAESADHRTAAGVAPAPRVRLETVVSAAAVAARYAARTGRSDLDGGSRQVVELADTGDEVARAVLRDAVELLADALATAVGLLGPVTIVLGGGLAQAGEQLLVPVRAALAARLGPVPAPTVRVATLGSWAGCLGAGALALGPATERTPA